MGCYYKVTGEFDGEFSQTIANEMVAAADDDGIYSEEFEIDAKGSVGIWGAMSYGNACAIDDFLKEQALKFGLTGRFETDCDGETAVFYVGTPQQQRDYELEHLTAEVERIQARMAELNALQF